MIPVFFLGLLLGPAMLMAFAPFPVPRKTFITSMVWVGTSLTGNSIYLYFEISKYIVLCQELGKGIL